MNLFQKIILVSFIFLCWSETGRAETDLVFEHLSTEDGLSHGSVSAMLKDRRGFMWFATWDGINRYDGHIFKTYKPGDAAGNGSASNRIERIREDSLGNIWVITFDARAFRLDHYTETFDPVAGPHDDDPVANITDVLPFASGDVWISTSNQGAYRVMTDPSTRQHVVLHFHESSEIAIPGNNVTFIAEDQQRNCWINTNKGLVCFETDRQSGKTKAKELRASVKTILSNNRLTTYLSNGPVLYFGTEKGTLLSYNHKNGEMTEIGFANASPITVLTRHSNGSVYIGTRGNGIFEYNEWSSTLIRHFLNPEIANVLNLHIDSKGLLWIESVLPGLSMIDLRTGRYRHFVQQLDVTQDLRPGPQCGLMEDENQTLWLTLKGGGFGCYNRETGEVDYFYDQPGNPESRFSNFVNCFYKDPAGVLWISTYFKGIEKVTFIPKRFRFIQPAPQSNLSIANEVRAIMEDSKGILWVATKKQELFLLDKDFTVIKKIDQLDGRKTGMIYALLEDSNGDIYLGTKGNGLFRLKRSALLEFSVSHFLSDPNNRTSISSNNIYALLEDRQGRLWVGTYGGGLNLMDHDRFLHSGNLLKNYPTSRGTRVRHLAQDQQGNIWIGTTEGVLFLDQQSSLPSDFTFRLFSKATGNAEGLRSNDVFWICCDQQGNTWMATLGGGLARLTKVPETPDTLRFSSFTKENGLPSDVIFTITADENGHLWMSTENGIAFYNPEEQLFRNYGYYDGIIRSGFSEAAVAKRSDGSICFGANNGIYSFHPSDFENEQKKIPLVFTGFSLFGKEVLPGEKSVLSQSVSETRTIKLRYNQNVFGLSWAGLDFRMQEKLQYAYQLSGYDSDWKYIKGLGSASYSKIPPGKYTFKIKFVNPELQEFNTPLSIGIEICPPFWKTTLAYFIYFLFSVALFFTVFRIVKTVIHLRNKVVIEKELTDIKLNFFTNVSHELRTPLTLILGPVRELKAHENLSEKGQAYAKLIEQNGRRLLRLVNQLLEFRKIQSKKLELVYSEVEMVPFIRGICRNFDEVAAEKNIRFTVTGSNEEIKIEIDKEKIDSVVYNLLSNAFKFTPDFGTIGVSVEESLADGNLTIEVKDSGIGISGDQEENLFEVFSAHRQKNQIKYPGTGIGLAYSKELVGLHQGELSYRPTPGGGATFSIRLKTGLTHLPTTSMDTNYKNPIRPESLLSGPASLLNGPAGLPRILIVEDNQELRGFLKIQLSDDYQVEEAVDGREGWDLAMKWQPDIILSDVMMPVMDGIMMLEKIKNNFDTSHIPVVLLSAKSSVESKIEGLKYGADAYLTKPFHSEQLKAQLENLLHQRQLLRESYTRQNGDEPATVSELTLTAPDARFLEEIRAIIEENLIHSEFKIEDIYKQLGMGRSKFFDKIKGLTGLSPIDFVKEYRLTKARSLLQTGEFNVTEASYLSGFTDSGYFSKCFKERFGVSPSQYAKKG